MDNFLNNYLIKTGITADDDKIKKLNTYYEMLVEKNKVMNLTAITEYRDVVIKHFADSAAIINAININNVENVIDIGTGAGFPGMVMKILFPNLKITLLDSLNKRINFLNEVIERLNLDGIKTIHGRAEEFAQNKLYREKYNLCVSRAVANLSTLSEYCIPFVAINGNFVSYKSGECEEEVQKAEKAVHRLGAKVNKIVDFLLPDTDINRKFIVIHKLSATPGIYPRKAGIPSKDPIK